MRQGLGQVKRAAVARRLLLCAFLVLAGCDDGPPHLSAGGAYIVMPPAPGRPATLYFVIDATNDPLAGPLRRLVGVRVEGTAYAEMHRSMTVDGMAQMRPLRSLPLADGVTRFCPGGHHVMLFGLDERIKPGAQVRVHLKLNVGGHLDPDAMIVRMGDAVRADPPFDCRRGPG